MDAMTHWRISGIVTLLDLKDADLARTLGGLEAAGSVVAAAGNIVAVHTGTCLDCSNQDYCLACSFPAAAQSGQRLLYFAVSGALFGLVKLAIVVERADAVRIDDHTAVDCLNADVVVDTSPADRVNDRAHTDAEEQSK